MNIEQERVSKSKIVLTLNGRLDTLNAPLLESRIKEQGDITELEIDFKGVDYISSMGLRVLLAAKKEMKSEGIRLIINNIQDSVHEIFEITGFLSLMAQEEENI
jgi:anti-sigma B factor antagonist